MAGYIGAEVSNIDISQPLPTSVAAELRSALLTHKVLFFRDQDLDHASQARFAENFGALVPSHPHSTAAADEYPPVLRVDPRPDEATHGKDHEERYRRRWRTATSGWHTDASPAVNPPAGAILRAEVTTPFGGDTQWVNLAAAYNGLSEPIQKLVDGLRAEHRFLAGFQVLTHDPDVAAMVDEIESDPLISVHPVVRVHPETGEKILFVNPSSTSSIVGLSASESRYILDLLFTQMTRPDYTVRFRWLPGSVAFWDNRSTAHLAATDVGHLGFERVLHRVTLLGEKPVGPDGFVSYSVAGRPFKSTSSTE